MIQESMMKFLRLTRPPKEGESVAGKMDAVPAHDHLQFQSILDHIDQGIIAVDARGKILSINAAACVLFDLEPERPTASIDELADTCELFDESGNIIAPHLWPHTEILKGELYPAQNLKVAHKSQAKSHIVRFTGMPVMNDNGEPVLAVITMRDISRDVRVTEMLRNTRNRLAAILSSIQEGFIVLDREWRLTYINSSAAQLLDSTPDEMNGRIIWEAFPQFSDTTFAQQFLAAAEKQELTRFEAYYPPTARWLECRCYPVPGGLTVLFTDNTEQRRLKEMLKNHKDQLADVLEGSNDGYWVWDLTTGKVEVSPRFLEILGMEQEDLTLEYEILYETAHPEDIAELKEAITGALKGEEGDRYEAEHRMRHDEGNYLWVFNRGKVTRRNEKGRAVRMSGTITDVTDRVYEKELLALSEELARGRLSEIEAIYQSAPVGLCVLDKRMRYIRINDRLAEINGIEAKEHIGKTIREVLPETADATEPQCLKVIETGMPVLNVEISGETPALPGVMRYWMEHFFPLQTPDGKILGINVVVEDITQRKHAEAQLKSLNATLELRVRERTQELQSLNADLQKRSRQLQSLTLMLSETEDNERRRLAEILHDDLQQLLASARLHLGRLDTWAQTDKKAEDILKQVNDILADSLKKTRNLSHELSPAILGRNSLAEALASLCKKMHSKHALSVSLDADEDAEPSTLALKTFLIKSTNELLFNVVKHAGVDHAQIRTRRTSNGIEVFMSDDGNGFDPQCLQSGGGRDVGIGLLSLRERISLMEGHLHIDSAPGRGSRFTLFVPDSAKKCPETDPAQPVISTEIFAPGDEDTGCGGNYAILLVDDHQMVRHGLKDILLKHRQIGVVYEAKNGREALEMAEKHRPDLVLMDVSMPQMNGIEATCAIKERWPDMRVAALSMYDEPDIRAAMLKAGACAYLDKSGPSEQIIEGLRKVFDSPDRAEN